VAACAPRPAATAARGPGFSWNVDRPGVGIVVGGDIAVVLAVEAMRDEGLERTGAIDSHRQPAAAER
jgi:hypothetical protein